MTHHDTPANQRGLSLIELMVAMVLGLVVAAGIISIFISTSASNRVQTQLARLQEEGRYAISRLTTDISQANGQYCTNTGGDVRMTSNAQVYVDTTLRSPMIYAAGTALMSSLSDVTTSWGSGTYPAAPTAAYSLPSFLTMRGYDCKADKSCTPVDPSTGTSIPQQGTALGDRVIGTSVLTMRYLNPNAGWTIYPTGSATGSTVTANASTGLLSTIKLSPTTGEPPITNVKANDLMMLASCSASQVFAVTGQGGATLTPAGIGSSNGQNWTAPSAQLNAAAPMLFDFTTDFQTVTYYLQVIQAADGVSTTGALMRRVNGAATPDMLATGVERLNFLYGVQYPDGTTHYLPASTVDASTASTPGCTIQVQNADATDKGCLWRAVKSIEIDLLMDGQSPLYTLSADEMQYTYSTDGMTLGAPSTAKVTPATQGFVNPLLRREFIAMVSVRNFNP